MHTIPQKYWTSFDFLLGMLNSTLARIGNRGSHGKVTDNFGDRLSPHPGPLLPPFIFCHQCCWWAPWTVCKTCLKLETGVEEVGVRGVSQVSISTMISSRYCNSHITTSSVSRAVEQFFGTSTQPSIPPRSVNKYQLRLGRKGRYGSFQSTSEVCSWQGTTQIHVYLYLYFTWAVGMLVIMAWKVVAVWSLVIQQRNLIHVQPS